MADTNDNQTNGEPLSDNDRLIAVLQSCFSELIKKQDEQADRLHRAVEALRPQQSTPDPKTTFWTSYMKLADEYDKEFQHKYSTDLDTALIFAGLFSAVSSAFIIQIQPQISSNSPTNLVAVQSLLYISLSTTLLAALLAVLGKQWVSHYLAAGGRGTVEQRGLERQRKLDGLRKWKFDTLLQMFPLLLQLALLLFSSALSVYLWYIHRLIAAFVLASTLFGVSSYLVLLLSAALYPDSPFQTPIASFLRPLLELLDDLHFILGQELRKFSRRITRLVESRTHILPSFVVSRISRSPKFPWQARPWAYFSRPSPEVPAVVWVLETSTDPVMISAAAEIVADLQWPLNLDLESSMAYLRTTFQSCFSRDLDARHYVLKVREGMEDRAIHCGMAFACLRHIRRALGDRTAMEARYPVYGLNANDSGLRPHLRSVIRVIGDWPELSDYSDTTPGSRWASHVIASMPAHRSTSGQGALEYFLDELQVEKITSLDEFTFTNYLCCITSFLTPLEHRILIQVDKRRLKFPIIIHLFKALRQSAVDNVLVARVINTAAQLAVKSVKQGTNPWYEDIIVLMTEISQFCGTLPPGREPLMVSAATLALSEAIYLPESLVSETAGTGWIFSALEYIQQFSEVTPNGPEETAERESYTTVAIRSLLQFLVYQDSHSLPVQPPSKVLDMILRALSGPGEISLLAFLILCRAHNWFLDADLRPIMQESSAWSQLGHLARKHPQVSLYWTELGKKIANVPEWKSSIYAALPAWITVFSDVNRDMLRTSKLFVSVIRSIWVPAFDQENLMDEKNETWVLTLAALSNAWESFEFSPSSPEFVDLARCTVSTSLRELYFHREFKRDIGWFSEPIPHDIRALFCPPLGKSLIQAAAKARNEITHTPDTTGSLDPPAALFRAAELLDVLGEKLNTEFEPTSGEVQLGGVTKAYRDWTQLRNHFEAELDELEGLLGVEQIDRETS